MKVFRSDQEGCYVGPQLTGWFASCGILQQAVPRDAHNELAVPEKHIDMLKETLTRTALLAVPD
eukprot:7539916-Alexandrium_andersonii.AAC.1